MNHSTREIPVEIIAFAFQVYIAQDLVDFLFDRTGIDAVSSSKEMKTFLQGQIVVKIEKVREVADMFPDLEIIFYDVKAENPGDRISLLTLGLGDRLMMELVERLALAQPPDVPDLPDDGKKAVVFVVEEILVQLYNLIQKGDSLRTSQNFILGMLTVLIGAVPDQGQGLPLGEVLERAEDLTNLIPTEGSGGGS